MALLSDIAHAVPLAAVAATLALRKTNPTAFRTAVVTYLKNKYPAVTITAADVAALKVVIIISPATGYVGFGRDLSDANAAIKKAVG